MKFLLLIAGIFVSITSLAQMDVVDSNYYTAYKNIDALKIKYTQSKRLAYSIKLTGCEYIKSHSKRPFLVDTAQLSGTFTFKNNVSEEQFSLRFRGKDYKSVTRFQNDSAYFADYGDTILKAYPLDIFTLEGLYNPYNIIEFINRNKKSLHYLKVGNESIIGFSGLDGTVYYCFFDPTTNLPSKIKKKFYDPVLGDVDDEIIYSDYKVTDLLQFPQSIIHKKQGAVYREFNVTSANCLNNSESANRFSVGITLDTIGNNLFLLNLTSYNNRVLILRSENSIAIFDAPIGFEVCSDIIRYIQKTFPESIIKVCFVSHHHPDHAGGIGAFAKAGVKIVTTSGNYVFFESIINSTHSRGDDEYFPLQKGTKADNFLDSVPLRQNKKIFINNEPVIAYEHGISTSHTDQFLSFYLPTSKVLFVGDLALFPKGKEIHQGARARAVLQLIEDNRLSVDKIITSWPLKGYKSFGTTDELRKSVAGDNIVK